MDMKFSGELQTALTLLGNKSKETISLDKFSPPKSQDPADRLLHEFFVSALMMSIGERRKKIAREMIDDMRKDDIEALAAQAVKLDAMQTETLIQTEHYNATMKINKPVQALDPDQFCVELIKLGVDQVTINKALAAAGKTRAPAKTLTVTTTNTRS